VAWALVTIIGLLSIAVVLLARTVYRRSDDAQLRMTASEYAALRRTYRLHMEALQGELGALHRDERLQPALQPVVAALIKRAQVRA
jgi:hypothetical protein